MLPELFWISLGVASEFDGYKKNPHINFERGKEYINRIGYNQQRQMFLHNLIYSSDINKKQQFYDILGHDIDLSKYKKYTKKDRQWIAYEEAMQEIAQREGWKYFDDNELYSDPIYRSLIGLKEKPAIISYKLYPDKVLLSPEELKKYNIDVSQSNSEHSKITFKSVVFPILFLLASIMFASIHSVIGIIITIACIIGTIISSYASWYTYRNEKANGALQFLTYILCPIVAPLQIMRACNGCEISSGYITVMGIAALIIECIHIVCVISYGISKHNKLN